jgi:hypothetical protein
VGLLEGWKQEEMQLPRVESNAKPMHALIWKEALDVESIFNFLKIEQKVLICH